MSNKLSHSQVSIYTTCPRKYRLHYRERYRSKLMKGALLFGSALDRALNDLLKTKDAEEAKSVFKKSWQYQMINNIGTYLPTANNIVYSDGDFDADLIEEEDSLKFEKTRIDLQYNQSDSLVKCISNLKSKKKITGFDNFSDTEKKLYNYGHWLCMRRKGLLMIDSYNSQIMPRIKEVIVIQKSISLYNEEGDKITGFLDLALVWEDGKRYILDNKTSAKPYDSDAPMKSQQLILYYHTEKEALNINGIGFIVLSKNIDKQKIKICKECGFDGSEGQFKTCNNTVNSKRCEGQWNVKINPKCYIQVLLSEVPEYAEELVIQTFDEANTGIKKEAFGPNLNACEGKFGKCEFYNICWKNDYKDVMKLEKKSS